MSELEKLIKKLCPNGVEYVSIGSLIRKITEKGKNDSTVTQVYVVSNSLGLVKAEEYREYTIHSEDTSNYTIVRPNAIAYNPARLNIGSIALNKSNLAGLVSPMYVVFDVDTSKILPEYLELIIKSKYILNKIDSLKEEGARFRFDFNRWDWIKIPLPPIEIQTKVITVLSKFSNYISLLQSEYSARKKQYEHYRDALLSFDDIRAADQTDNGGGYNNNVIYRKLGEIFNTRNGYTPLTSNPEYWDNGSIPWFVMDDIRKNGRVLSDSSQHITKSAVKKSGLFPANSIIVTTSATIGEHALITADFLCNQRFTCLSVKDEFKGKLNIKFAFYYTFKLDDFCKRNTTKSSFSSVDMNKFYNFEIPVPPLETQKRIVSILDKFEMLANSLSDGLPAEIEARKKQYEYYRDKLLDFKDVGGGIVY